jgi:hypothetical protein
MSDVQVEQKNYRMPPQDGITIAHFITVADIERSARFYEKVFGGKILSRGDSSGAPGCVQIANTWLIVNVGGGPTPGKPIVTLSVPPDPDAVSNFMSASLLPSRRRFRERLSSSVLPAESERCSSLRTKRSSP